MKYTTTLLTAALLAVIAVPAFAQDERRDDARISSDTYLSNDVTLSGEVRVEGEINVGGESKAIVDQDQTTLSNGAWGDGDNNASVGDQAMQGASGNIGLNVAAGVGNVQTNDTALAAIDGQDVFAGAQVFNAQSTEANMASDAYRGDGVANDASLGDSALADASGNIGVNIAAGVGNAQSNGMAASVNTSGNLAWATADSRQTTMMNELDARRDLDNTATLNGSALANASGNIGVNIAAGVGNAQHNGLSIAVASCGTCAPPPPPPCTTGCGNTGG